MKFLIKLTFVFLLFIVFVQVVFAQTTLAPAEREKGGKLVAGGGGDKITAPRITKEKAQTPEEVKKESGRKNGSKLEATEDKNITAVGKDYEKAQTPEEVKKESMAKVITEAAINEGVQKFEDLPSLQAKIFFFYSPTSLYDVFCKDGYITDIQLQPGEEPLYVGGGDTVRWIIDKAQSGIGENKQWHILIKPLKSKISTNLIITTDKHSYQLRLHSSNFFNPFVGWSYPSEDKAAFLRQAAIEKKRADETISIPITPDKLNFGYKIESVTSWYQSDFSWMPKLAFNDGTKTYIQMSSGMKSGEAPALFVKDGEGVALVNYRVKDNYYIIDRLFEQAELRCGMKEIVVISRITKNAK